MFKKPNIPKIDKNLLLSISIQCFSEKISSICNSRAFYKTVQKICIILIFFSTFYYQLFELIILLIVTNEDTLFNF